MPSLKEVKTRISSVQSTRKITNAMKMVASSKLHKAQQTIENMRPYEGHLHRIMAKFVSDAGEVDSPYTKVRPLRRVALVAASSNSSLCGGFNQNVIRQTKHLVEVYRSQGAEVEIWPIGKKIGEAMSKAGFAFPDDRSALLAAPSFQQASLLAEELMTRYGNEELDKIVLVYNHFKSASSQEVLSETYLPIDLDNLREEERTDGKTYDFIIEPSKERILTSLVPTTLHLKMYTIVCDSLASEHAARIIAMQVATDNADELLQELTLTYNKTRQQAITNELLDIIGGSLQ